MTNLYFIYDIHAVSGYIKRICNNAKSQGKAILPNTKISFKGNYTYGVITPDKVESALDEGVEGWLYDLNDSDSIEFDRTIKLNSGLKKKRCKVYNKSGKLLSAFIFVYSGDGIRDEMPLREYYAKLELMYEERGFDIESLRKALFKTFARCYKSVAKRYKVIRKTEVD